MPACRQAGRLSQLARSVERWWMCIQTCTLIFGHSRDESHEPRPAEKLGHKHGSIALRVGRLNPLQARAQHAVVVAALAQHTASVAAHVPVSLAGWLDAGNLQVGLACKRNLVRASKLLASGWLACSWSQADFSRPAGRPLSLLAYKLTCLLLLPILSVHLLASEPACSNSQVFHKSLQTRWSAPQRGWRR